MITYVKSNIFSSSAQVLVNAVNIQGVMGKGIAAEFKRRYPQMFEEYRKLCKQGQFKVGQLHLFKTPDSWILNFPTKDHWRNASKIEYVDVGLQRFLEIYEVEGIQSISFPMLGCGYGGLDWDTEVKPLMEKNLNTLPILTYIHLYHGDSQTNAQDM